MVKRFLITFPMAMRAVWTYARRRDREICIYATPDSFTAHTRKRGEPALVRTEPIGLDFLDRFFEERSKRLDRERS